MPLVVRDGKVVETGVTVGSLGWQEFLEGNSSFRYETVSHGGYTATKQNDYWYASRKYQGKLYRKYIGTTSELNINQLDAAAIALVEMIEQSTVKERTAVKPASPPLSSNGTKTYAKLKKLAVLGIEPQSENMFIPVIKIFITGKICSKP